MMQRERTRRRPGLPVLPTLVALTVAQAGDCLRAATNPAIERAMASDEVAATVAARDSARPVYHFRPVANWMNDPNGPIALGGWYHMFYQHNPYGDQWGHMHWGHARSRDLVRWEHLPIALWPSEEKGEEHIFSGCATTNGAGQPMIIYTSIARGKSAGDYAEQWAAIGDDDLMVWRKHPANPILSEQLHGDQKMSDWRDPFVFRDQGRTYLVAGGNLNHGKGGQAVVNLYEAENSELTKWKYWGVMFTHPDPEVGNIECPNFFKLGNRWVLVVSPHRKVEYFIGTFDSSSHKFSAESRGVMDYGNYYAPNCLYDPSGRLIMWGWINGFKSGRGWNGCLTLPRVLSLAADGRLEQRPVPEIEMLRDRRVNRANLLLDDSTGALKLATGDALEIEAKFESGDAKSVGLEIRRTADSSKPISIRHDGRRLTVGDVEVPFSIPSGETTLRLHVFLDKSVMEVFANDRACVTRVIDAGEGDVAAIASGGQAKLKSIDVWTMKPIW